MGFGNVFSIAFGQCYGCRECFGSFNGMSQLQTSEWSHFRNISEISLSEPRSASISQATGAGTLYLGMEFIFGLYVLYLICFHMFSRFLCRKSPIAYVFSVPPVRSSRTAGQKHSLFEWNLGWHSLFKVDMLQFNASIQRVDSTLLSA